MINKNLVSIVLYDYNLKKIKNFVKKIYLNNENCLIFLIDNSSCNNINYFSDLHFVTYVKTDTNLGYGKGHNISIKYAIKNSVKYCFILNYDIEFEDSIFKKMMEYLNNNIDTAMVMPKIINKNNLIQWLPKLQPAPTSILKRKIYHLSFRKIFKKFMSEYEFRSMDLNLNYNVSNLSGCFFLLNINLLKDQALFDERYFLYFEDYDLSRSITTKYKTVLFNKTFIIHDYQSRANKNLFLFYIFLLSFIKYFNKWGWFNTSNLKLVNKNIFVVN
jgi:GT2 family glycosyltransferase